VYTAATKRERLCTPSGFCIPVDHRRDTNGQLAVLFAGQRGDNKSKISAGVERGDGKSIPIPFMQRDSGRVNNPAGQSSRKHLLVAAAREYYRDRRLTSPEDDVKVSAAVDIAAVGGHDGVIGSGGVQDGLEQRSELRSQSFLLWKGARYGAARMIVHPDGEQFVCLPNRIEQHAADDEDEHGDAGEQANTG